MKKIIEPARSVDVVLETDVLIVGSGPGGLAAALAAARAGARTALIDRNGCFGGNITQVGVEGFAWYRHEQTVDCEGIGIEFETRAQAMGAAMPEPQSLSHALDAEMFKWVADVLVDEAGVKPLLHRLGVAPIMENGAICGVITESKAGREAILAKRVIDATGDADIATRAGAPVHKTPKEKMLAVSVMFSMSGVNKRVSSTRSKPIRKPTRTGRATRNGTTRRRARKTRCFPRSCASPSRKHSTPESFLHTCIRSPVPGVA